MSVTHRNSPHAELISDDYRTGLKSSGSHGMSHTATILTGNAPSSPETPGAPENYQVAYQATTPAQDVFFINPTQFVYKPGVRHTHGESPTVTKSLLVECDDCGGAGRVTPDHPMDPFATVWTCSMCDGTGEVLAGCECCREDAVERFDGSYLCEQHLAEARADALLESAP